MNSNWGFLFLRELGSASEAVSVESGMDAEGVKGGAASRTLLKTEGLRHPSSFCSA
jgi:hypothetical protein